MSLSSKMIKSEIIQQKKFYKIRKIKDTESQKIVYFEIKFDKNVVQNYQLEKAIQYNSSIFTKPKELNDGQNIHHINRIKFNQIGDQYFYIGPYEYRLNQHIKKRNGVTEEESIKILTQIVQAIYSLYINRYVCANLRLENFVYAQTEKGARWKLQSIPFKYKDYEDQQINSPFTYNKKYQPPEAFVKSDGKIRQKKEMQELVWNIGCMWLELLYGNHFLITHDKIKEYCKGSGESGIFNSEIFGVRQKLNSENKRLLSLMLNYYPEERLLLIQIFKNKKLGENINFFQQQLEAAKMLVSGFSIRIDKYMNKERNQNCYSTIEDYIGSLIKIANEKNISPHYQESKVMSSFIKKLPANDQSHLSIFMGKISSISSKAGDSKRLDQRQQLTEQKLQLYIKPYKFYYDKTLFLANAQVYISEKLYSLIKFRQTQSHIKFVAQSMVKNNEYKSVIESNEIFQPYDKLILFEFAVLLLRLIYLQTMAQYVTLYQNIFSIPSCSRVTVNNDSINNDDKQWLNFSDTATYQSLKIFFEQKKDECHTEMQKFFEKAHSEVNNLLTQSCKKKINQIFDKYNFETCPVAKFYKQYQQILKQVFLSLDTSGILNNDLVLVSSCILKEEEKQKKSDEIKVMCYLEIAAFIESQNLFNPKYFNQFFGKYYEAQGPSKEPQFQSFEEEIFTSRLKPQKSSVIKPSNQLFSFENYQAFVNNSDNTQLTNHLKKLLKYFCLS